MKEFESLVTLHTYLAMSGVAGLSSCPCLLGEV